MKLISGGVSVEASLCKTNLILYFSLIQYKGPVQLFGTGCCCSLTARKRRYWFSTNIKIPRMQKAKKKLKPATLFRLSFYSKAAVTNSNPQSKTVSSASLSSLGSRVLLINPPSETDHVPVLRSERLRLVMLDMRVKVLVQNGEVVERNGGIGMMLCMEVRLP